MTGKSPAELIRSNLRLVQKISKKSRVEEKQKCLKSKSIKCQYDEKALELKLLKVGDCVRLRNSYDSKWSKKGEVKSQIQATFRSYVAEVPGETSYTHNRKDILKAGEKFDSPDFEAEILVSDLNPFPNHKFRLFQSQRVCRRQFQIR